MTTHNRNGMILRLAMLMTQYRAPINWTEQRQREAALAYDKFMAVAVPSDVPPPADFLAAMHDDMNTPKAISLMHGYAKSRRGEALYASMALLGLVPPFNPQTEPTSHARLSDPA